jgi:hypothetical protein
LKHFIAKQCAKTHTTRLAVIRSSISDFTRH